MSIRECDLQQESTITNDDFIREVTSAGRSRKIKLSNLAQALASLIPLTLRNLVDGQAAGSIRGVNTRAEGASYFLGEDACAFGKYTQARGQASIAEGRNTRTGDDAICAHAEGFASIADGWYSHAQNFGTYASYQSQTAIGENNRNLRDTLLEIGNGTGTISSARSNALSVYRNGEIDIYLNPDLTAGDDFEIIQALTNLGWTDCITE